MTDSENRAQRTYCVPKVPDIGRIYLTNVKPIWLRGSHQQLLLQLRQECTPHGATYRTNTDGAPMSPAKVAPAASTPRTISSTIAVPSYYTVRTNDGTRQIYERESATVRLLDSPAD